ncbi:hypothetical protein C8A00DRAFT_19541 [Chaetomidium leptoderma]|uniref:Uncharacterized protein n=1 Tax=Chaetomidium leptoderma TaxID=669021 RepID=A0AAN6VDT3_9PEZI|nr:hypothetical protein C8A00DRAFT_19541 [Chaetomidium leptoderma]
MRKVFNGKYATHIPWAVLQEEARGAFNWLVNHEGFNGFVTTNPQPKDMACLVMALHVRRPGGGVIYFGTIGRGKRAEEMTRRSIASVRAPVWWYAIGDAPPNRIHCEDVCWYGFERYNTNLPNNSPEKIFFAAGGSGAGAGRGQGGPGQAPPGQGGQARPKLSPRNVLAAIHRAGKGETDEEGHPVYIGQRVIVNAYGNPDGRYFCFDSQGNAFASPPEPSTSKDHKSKRAAALYAIAKGLYKGKRRIANIDDYNELTAYEAAQRPSSSGSGGSGGSGEYTTRPVSRGGGGDYSSASAQPRTTAYDTQQPPADSQGSAPAQKTPKPPSKVKLGGKGSSISVKSDKTNGGYYIRNVSQSDPKKEYPLHYSDSKKKFFVLKTVSSKSGKTKEEIYLTPA